MYFTNRSILETALKQSAADSGCNAEDFLRSENVVVISREHPDARKYLTLPFECDLVSYGSNIVASVTEPYREIVSEYIARFPVEHCFETPNMLVLEDALRERGLRVCFMAEYFLPDLDFLTALECRYGLRVLSREELVPLHTEQWSNALSAKRPHLDVLGVGAYDGEALVGLAGCSADCDNMWQIGVDVLPEYRRQGIASAVTSRLALEILERGKVPFYCAAWSNIRSVRNAIKSGFRPAWVELTAKPAEMVNGINGVNVQ